MEHYIFYLYWNIQEISTAANYSSNAKFMLNIKLFIFRVFPELSHNIRAIILLQRCTLTHTHTHAHTQRSRQAGRQACSRRKRHQTEAGSKAKILWMHFRLVGSVANGCGEWWGGAVEGGVYFRVLARILCLRPGLVIYNSHPACTVGSERKKHFSAYLFCDLFRLFQAERII